MSLWIPAHQELARHPKVRRVARDLDTSRAEVVGRLMFLWWWALDYAQDGYIGDYYDLCDALDIDPDDDGYIDSLVAHGFLDAMPEGWMIHDWADYAGKAVGAREARRSDGAYGNHVRWHVHEGRANPDCQWCSGGDSGGDRGANRRAEQSRADEIRAEQAGITTEDLYTEARAVLAERQADGYQIDDPARFLKFLIQTEEVQHRARKRAWAQ